MEPRPQRLRMTFYGERDHSGTVWAVCKGDFAGSPSAVWVNSADQGQGSGFAATAFQGETPRRGAHVA